MSILWGRSAVLQEKVRNASTRGREELTKEVDLSVRGDVNLLVFNCTHCSFIKLSQSSNARGHWSENLQPGPLASSSPHLFLRLPRSEPAIVPANQTGKERCSMQWNVPDSLAAISRALANASSAILLLEMNTIRVIISNQKVQASINTELHHRFEPYLTSIPCD